MNNENKILTLNIDDILPNRFQPRIKFNEQAINELAESIKIHGVIQPIVVRKISDKYEIIAGERRYKASILAGKSTIPAIITDTNDKDSAEIALIENVQRQDLTPIEEAISYKKILDMGYISQTELGDKLGKKQSTIANKLRLLNLNDEVQEALMENKISERHARSLLRLDEKKQILMLNRIINERLTVRKTDEEIEKLINVSENITNEKEENNMNEDILKEFNIPTNPIIEDKNDEIIFDLPTESVTQESVVADIPSVEPIQSTVQDIPSFEPIFEETLEQVKEPVIEPIQPINTMNEYNTIENNSINPGFMDLNKIQSEAQDIISEPAPVANMEELLKPSENVAPVMEQINPVAEIQTNLEQQTKEPESRPGKFFNMFNFNVAPTQNTNFVENIEESQTNMNFEEIPSLNNQNLDAPNIFGQNIENNDVIENSISDQEIPVQNNFMGPIDEVEQLSTAPNDEIIINNVIPMEQSSSNLNKEPELPTFEETITPFSLTDDQTFTSNIQNEYVERPYMMDNDVTFDDEGEIEVKLPEQDVKAAVDMKTVINTIRECAATIEKFGYKLETDEVDLNNIYEVTFRIEKM